MVGAAAIDSARSSTGTSSNDIHRGALLYSVVTHLHPGHFPAREGRRQEGSIALSEEFMAHSPTPEVESRYSERGLTNAVALRGVRFRRRVSIGMQKARAFPVARTGKESLLIECVTLGRSRPRLLLLLDS